MTPGGTPPERVVIIGAGVSGLALAGRLVRAGIRARILDSAPRIAET